MSAHQPWPSWLCGDCDMPWPCEMRRTDLLLEYSRAWVSLILIMFSHFVAACQDLPEAKAGDLHERFLGWIPEATGDR